MSASPRSPTITTRAARRSKPTAPTRSTSRCRRNGSISAEAEWKSRLESGALARLTPFADPDATAHDAGTRQGRNFAPERTEAEANVFDAVTKHVQALQAAASASSSRCGPTARASA